MSNNVYGRGNVRGVGNYDNNNAAIRPTGIPLFPPMPGNIIPKISERLLPRFKLVSATFIITMVEIAVFIATLIFAGAVLGQPIFAKENLMVGPSTAALGWMGGKDTACIRAGQVWRFFTPIVLHAGIIHLFSNLIFQLYLGFSFEKRWGAKRFIALYVLTGFCASLISAVSSPDAVGVGASGSLFGLVGANVTYLAMNWEAIPQNKPEACLLVFIILINFMFGVSGGSGNVDNMAHLGGLISGACFGAYICPPIYKQSNTKAYQITGVVLSIVYIGSFLGAIYGVNYSDKPCPYTGSPSTSLK